MSDPLNAVSLGRLLQAPAADAAQGQRTHKAAESAAREADFEPLDRLLLRRLRNQPPRDAAGQVVRAADAAELAERIRILSGDDPAALQRAHGELNRSHLRHLLGG